MALSSNSSDMSFPGDSLSPMGDEQFLRSVQSAYDAMFRAVMALCPEKSFADDIVQETLVVLWRKYHQDGPPDNFTPWACKVAMNTARNMLRYENRRMSSMPLDEDSLKLLARSHAGVNELLELRREYLRNCLQQLKQREHHLVSEYYVLQKSIKEIAHEQDGSIDAVYGKLRRIRRKLFECINRRIQRGESV